MYLQPLHMSLTDLAEAILQDPAQAKRLLREDLHITADLALCLSRAFLTTPEFWMNMQANYDLQQALASPDLLQRLEKIKPIPRLSTPASSTHET